MKNFLKGKITFFVSGNINKFNEASQILAEYKIAVALLRKIDAVEIQDDNIENIAKKSAVDVVRRKSLPIIVEDAGLFIDALKGFPGPYSSYVYRKVGNSGILRLMENVNDREACFKSAVAYLSPEMKYPLCFKGEFSGEIVEESIGSKGFGFDPIFRPHDSKKTFAEMSLAEKNQHSHRALAFRKFAEWFTASF